MYSSLLIEYCVHVQGLLCYWKIDFNSFVLVWRERSKRCLKKKMALLSSSANLTWLCSFIAGVEHGQTIRLKVGKQDLFVTLQVRSF